MTDRPDTESARHYGGDVDEDEDGWWWAVCSCGQQFGPFPGRGEANDELADHRAQSEAPGVES